MNNVPLPPGAAQVKNAPTEKPGTKSEVKELAQSYTVEVMNQLLDITRDPDANTSARVAAGNILLDRGWGKPQQEIEHKVDMKDVIKQLQMARGVKDIDHKGAQDAEWTDVE